MKELIFGSFFYLLSLASPLVHAQAYWSSTELEETHDQLSLMNEWSFRDNTTVSYSKNIAKKDRFIFASCISSQETPPKIICHVISHVLDGSSFSGRNTFCIVEFGSGDGNQSMDIEFDVTNLAFGYLERPRKPVITWDEIFIKNQSAYKYIGVLDMKTCQVSTLDIRIPLNDSKISIDQKFEAIIYEDTIDVIIYQNEECPDSKWCRIFFDENGQKIGEPQSFPLDMIALNLTLAGPLTNSKDIFAYGVSGVRNASKLVAYHVHSHGVTELETNITIVNLTSLPLVSIDNNMFLICGKHFDCNFNVTDIHCNQFVNGSTKPEFDFRDTVPYDLLNVHNMPDGRILAFGLSDIFDGVVPESRGINFLTFRRIGKSFKREDKFGGRFGISRYDDEYVTSGVQNEHMIHNDQREQNCVYYVENHDFSLYHEKVCIKGDIQ
ncbi:hypothetical protein QAD02_018346 [Eretmocerus hayati]|uniref:Uncharacterized protein n=1 Tax=Eretmocerus hayati TaxID=131215 RepID=A0ACC2PG48_9HYME|nr:hypothetical protein QAD02_018346 [Eretmocerus hayati]